MYLYVYDAIRYYRIITVHGRTKEMKGKLVAGCDWDAIRRIKEALPVPVFSNGAISSSKDVERRVVDKEFQKIVQPVSGISITVLYCCATAAVQPFFLCACFLFLFPSS